MTEPQYRQTIALFRYGLIADLIHLPAGSRRLYALLRDKAAADNSIPVLSPQMAGALLAR